ncbi:ParA family protein [Gloeobacter violaceus]|uniref:Glr3251 protein n=1 Tax=Gloeobacter violaceus (strain ATCC 29082 / PCC 7421) TaxID=251221 RepID=Q7NGC1_GLOVI|nr:ParA family protein [Gloeobacter violaceus]BAC91192.1 glr3251 [Gloeobacter violaceus PCC 7421]
MANSSSDSNVDEQIKRLIKKALKPKNSDQFTIEIQRTALNWIRLKIVSDHFAGKMKTEREEIIDSILIHENLSLGKYPFAGYELLTQDELLIQPPQFVQLPLWSEILMAPESHQVISSPDQPKRPLVVSFYSFKGGVGRTTSLGIVAGILATRKRKIVMVDFDLEAPGLSAMFRNDRELRSVDKTGVVDYLYQRYLTPDEDCPKIQDCIQAVNLEHRGELFLIPAGNYDEEYVHKLADLNIETLYRRSNNPVLRLIDDISTAVNPDVILIDSRPGFNNISAVSIFDLADLAIICFTPTDQSFEGLRIALKAIRKQQEYQGRPDIHFLLTPIPLLAQEQSEVLMARVEEWLSENYGVPNNQLINEMYNVVYYNARTFLLRSLVNGIPKEIQDAYTSIADIIDASLPDVKSDLPGTKLNKNKSDQIIKELEFKSATAQELDPSEIPNIFQKTEDFPRFLSKSTWLIRGAKGTGKSLLFRLFIEQANEARKLAEADVELKNVRFVAGHGRLSLVGPMLESTDLNSFEGQAGELCWQSFWINYALLRLCHSDPKIRELADLDPSLVSLSASNDSSHSKTVNWLVERAKNPLIGPKSIDEIRTIDRWLGDHRLQIWLLYDELDAGFSSNYEQRKRAIEALLSWWLESGNLLKNITPKIFIREDIWNRLDFTNKGHYTGHSVELRWEEADLWRLILRQVLRSSTSFTKYLKDTYGISLQLLDNISLDQLRKGLYPLWGERMGRTKKAYTYNWVRTRIADGKNNCFPRSLIYLLQKAVKIEKSLSRDYSTEIILRPKSLIEAFPDVSDQRVDEVCNEYPEFKEHLDKLQSERSPIGEDRLAEVWDMQESEVILQIKSMVEAGILVERTRPVDPPPRLYAVAELYLYGLKMVRKGQR